MPYLSPGRSIHLIAARSEWLQSLCRHANGVPTCKAGQGVDSPAPLVFTLTEICRRKRLLHIAGENAYATLLDFDFDLAGLGRFLLGERDRQDAILIIGADLVALHGGGKRESADEVAVAAFNAVVALHGF